MEKKQRTNSQNASLHLLFTQMSDSCVERGIDQKRIIEVMEGYPVPTTPEFIKGRWKVIQEHMYGTTSTTELESKQIDKIYDVMNLLFSEELGVRCVFPSRDEQAFESLIKDYG